MVTLTEFRTVLDDLVFPECPRWRDGALWFTDMQDHRVVRVEADGSATTVVRVEHDVPSGIGWLADGRLLVILQETQQLMRLEPDGSLTTHADLSGVARGTTNDMIVRSDGTAYVGDMGIRIHEPAAERHPGQIVAVSPTGSIMVVAGDLAAPNGMILSPDETVLIAAESAGMRLTSFSVAPDGRLSASRPFAALTPEDSAVPYAPPDGICLDADGAVWAADPIGKRLLRVLDGGAVTDSIRPPDGLIPYACVLGGPERRTLYSCVARGHTGAAVAERRDGALLALEIEVGGAGAP